MESEWWVLVPGPEPSEKRGDTRQLAFGEGMGLGCPSTCGRVLMSENEAGEGRCSLVVENYTGRKTCPNCGFCCCVGAVRAERNIPVGPCFYFFVGVHE